MTRYRIGLMLIATMFVVGACSGEDASDSDASDSEAATEATTESNSAVVLVVAHPDDELTISPLLAHYAKAGVDVYLVSVTSGQQGGGITDISVGDELGAAREAELSAAAAAYGINEPIFIRNQDGEQDSLSDAETAELKADLRAVFEDVGAQVVITFGPEGFTGHADHIAVGAITTELVDEWQAEDDNELAPDRLYQTMFPESFSTLLPAGTDFVGVADAEATTIVDASDGIAEAEAAVLEYVTQFPEDQMTLVQSLIRDLSQGQIYLRWTLAKEGAPVSGGRDIFS